MIFPDNKIVKEVIQDIINKMNSDNSQYFIDNFGAEITFYVGTPIDTDEVHQKDYDINGVKLKYPFIALFEPNEIEPEFDENRVELGVANIWMVFMTEANYDDWTTEEHYTNAIIPMNNIYQKFIETVKIRVDNTVGEPLGLTKIDHAKWGLVAKFQGHTANIFSDKLSGVEITNFKLPILKDYTC